MSSRPIAPTVSDHARALVNELCNQSFDVGEYTDSSDQHFDDLADRANTTVDALLDYIGRLEAVLREMVSLAGTDDWHDSGRVLDALDDARAVLAEATS